VSFESLTSGSDLQARTHFTRVVGKLERLCSPWHDIPLYASSASDLAAAGVKPSRLLHFVNEIPLGSQAKMEIATDEEWNPIKQDTKNGELRFILHGPLPWNYGAIPQTWEDPSHRLEGTEFGGDNDPVDVVELGAALPFGAVARVKVLGALGLIDDGEIDWKLLAIAETDPLFSRLNDLDDVEKYLPNRIDEVREWYRVYKLAEGKAENEYAYEGRALNAEEAYRIVDLTHRQWREGRLSREPAHLSWSSLADQEALEAEQRAASSSSSE